jgi:hypothetical protein
LNFKNEQYQENFAILRNCQMPTDQYIIIKLSKTD